jgi:hypothetical protein
MTTPAPHEPCCECFECPRCNAIPDYFSAVISGVASTPQCAACEDANELYGLERIPCENVPCGWYTFEHCQRLDNSCGHVRLLELRIAWVVEQGVLISKLGLSLEDDSGGYYWEQQIAGPIDCYGGFSFTANNYVSGTSDCDYSQATIVLSGTDDHPCY